MLKLINIKKEYNTGGNTVSALKGIDVEFRKNEFVSVLGPSGCGKTTLLNIIGGLDRYNEGDLQILGRSTKEYNDSDWDAYRNHTVGFVFQSYNLIEHQSVLSNVELALTLTGVSRAERRAKAKAALEKVGLGDQISKKPNQMSGGQMQRVAIARALVNDPEILLADEPTGALDSETSIQIMNLLKEISQDRLVIMVTHNPELAKEYSTRIIHLFDGEITLDTNPYEHTEQEFSHKKQKKPSMSFLTAFSLSCNNLLTKKARTFLTSFAGSIGIIGIALILSLSNGVDTYINRVEEDTLSSYPILIEQTGTNVGELITTLSENKNKVSDYEDGKIYSNNIMTDMMTSMVNGSNTNDLKAFKEYIENESDEIKKYTSDIKYSYSTTMNIYTPEGYKVNPSEVFEKLGFKNDSTNPMMQSTFTNAEVWKELLDNKELLDKQYDVIAGRMPKNFDEIVVIVNENNEISDYTLYTLGLKDSDELAEMMEKAMNGEKLEKTKQTSYTYDEILSLEFKVLLNTDYFQKAPNGIWVDMSDDEVFVYSALEKAIPVKVVGILKADSNTAADSMASGTVGYMSGLMVQLIEQVNQSEIVKQQKENPDVDIFTSLPFKTDKQYTMQDLEGYISTLDAQQKAQFSASIAQMKSQGMSDEQILQKFSSYFKPMQSDSTYEGNLQKLGVSDLSNPSSISLYPKDFQSKENISLLIDNYNATNEKNKEITYTDYIGILLSSVTTIINAISYILIAFVSISLIVSSIMIGIITYISVLERTKEIGILRAMGASKRDISNVFNAETIIIGLASGAVGIVVCILLLIPINAIINHITNIQGLATLPAFGAISLIIISILLTFIAGLIPSRIAAKKDPVTALRSE